MEKVNLKHSSFVFNITVSISNLFADVHYDHLSIYSLSNMIKKQSFRGIDILQKLAETWYSIEGPGPPLEKFYPPGKFSTILPTYDSVFSQSKVVEAKTAF